MVALFSAQAGCAPWVGGGGQQGPVGGGSSPACLPSPGAPRVADLGPPPLAPQRRQLAPAVTEAAALSSRILFPEALGWLLVGMPLPRLALPASSALSQRDCREGSERRWWGFWCGVGCLVQGLALPFSSWVTLCTLPLSLHLENGAHDDPCHAGPGRAQGDGAGVTQRGAPPRMQRGSPTPRSPCFEGHFCWWAQGI